LGSREKNVVGDPPEVQDVKCKQVADKLVRESLITSEDLKKMLEHCFTLRDKAFIHVHYESGTRAGDILSLQIKHVSSDKYGMKIAVDGKTGARPIRLVESVPSLAKYLEGHPFNDDPEAPLWINLGNQDYGKPLQYAAANKLLKAAARRAGIKKRVYLHLFRHSAATRGVSYMGESIMRKRYGWSPNSKMISRHAHLNPDDLDDCYLDAIGIKVPETKEQERSLVTCGKCQTLNTPETDLYISCQLPLTMQTAIMLDDKTARDKEAFIAETIPILLEKVRRVWG
jgi:integrase/recombinase XerD